MKRIEDKRGSQKAVCQTAQGEIGLKKKNELVLIKNGS